VPEIVNFINFALMELGGVNVDGLPETRPANLTATLGLSIKDMPMDVPTKPTFASLFETVLDEQRRKVQLFITALELLEAASDTWKSSPAYPEIFHQTSLLLTQITQTKPFTALPIQVQTQTQTLLTSLTRRSKLAQDSRAALTLQAHRPIPIPSYLPKFSMSHSFDSKNDPDHARAAQSKLKAVHRREKKSVIRELRKEARTAAVVQSEEGKRRDRIYEDKMKVAKGIMKAGNDVGKWERDQKRKRK
jgi:nucleolar protein 14